MANFLVEFTNFTNQEDSPIKNLWVVSIDSSSTEKHNGARVVLSTLEGREFKYAIRMRFRATNNEIEYEAVIAGLTIASELGTESIEI